MFLNLKKGENFLLLYHLGDRKNMWLTWSDIYSDEYCPHCDNHFVLEAKTPKPALQIEGEDARKDSRFGLPTPNFHERQSLIVLQDVEG